MDYKSLSTKVPRTEYTLIEDYCERKGTTVSRLLRDAVLKEISVPVPHHIAGHNHIEYQEDTDTFSWKVQLDNGKTLTVIEHVSAEYVEELSSRLMKAMGERNTKTKRNTGVAVPSQLGGSND